MVTKKCSVQEKTRDKCRKRNRQTTKNFQGFCYFLIRKKWIRQGLFKFVVKSIAKDPEKADFLDHLKYNYTGNINMLSPTAVDQHIKIKKKLLDHSLIQTVECSRISAWYTIFNEHDNFDVKGTRYQLLKPNILKPINNFCRSLQQRVFRFSCCSLHVFSCSSSACIKQNVKSKDFKLGLKQKSHNRKNILDS